MKITKKNLTSLIENYLHESRDGDDEAKGVAEGDIAFNPYDFFTITKTASDYKGTVGQIKEFLKLLGYVIGFEVVGYDSLEKSPKDARKILQVTSGRRSGMQQLNAWLGKIAAGETQDETIALYSPGTDPAMTKETRFNAETAYESLKEVLKKQNIDDISAAKLKNSEAIKHIADWLERNPPSSHMSGEALDLRIVSSRIFRYIKKPGTQNREQQISFALEYMKKNNLANFFYQVERKPPHIHIGPLNLKQQEWVTAEGLNKISEYESKIDDQFDKEDPIPYESMP
jgi:hypothetical protein